MPLKELSETEAEKYEPIGRTVYEIGELKNSSFLEKAPEGATAYRVINEWWTSFKVEYYKPKQEPAQ
jgi:hypothetical protein